MRDFPGGTVVKTPHSHCRGSPGQGTKIPHAVWHGQKKIKKKKNEGIIKIFPDKKNLKEKEGMNSSLVDVL